MRVALDTNAYVDLCRGVADTVALMEQADSVMLPFVVLGEQCQVRRVVGRQSPFGDIRAAGSETT